MKDNKTTNLITGEDKRELFFIYKKPPRGETLIKGVDYNKYLRKVYKYYPSNHFISECHFDLSKIYNGEYINSTYKNQKNLHDTFIKIINLDEKKSDNYGRFKTLKEYCLNKHVFNDNPNLLDIGSGLGVFPYIVKKNGWNCTSIDPDPICIKHIHNNLKLEAICADFMDLKPHKKFDIVTLNKVLEHVNDPIKMLRKVKNWVKNKGIVYLELPDGEMASMKGKNREEFFIEHINIFSLQSTIILAKKSGFLVNKIERLVEPSGKYTIRAYLELYND